MGDAIEKYRERMFGSKNRCKRSDGEPSEKDQDCSCGKVESALRRAHEIRQFEIELLWKRATYAAIFQTLLFAALGLTFSRYHTPESAHLFRFILSIVGIFSAFFWYLINQGSKFWHENWEHHIDFLEDESEGRLHKTVLHEHERKAYSVSRANIYISFVFFVAWGVLALIFALELLDFPFDYLALIDWVSTSSVWVKSGVLAALIAIIWWGLWHCHRKLKTNFRNTRKCGKLCWIKQNTPCCLVSSPLAD